MARKGKTPSESETLKTEVVCPDDSNPLGILLGGRLIEWMDMAAAVTAQLHSGMICLTVSIDKVKFLNSARVGDIVLVRSKIHRSFNTSMEIGLEANVKNIIDGTNVPICKALFYFVISGKEGKNNFLPEVVPETDDEIHKYNEALKNRSNNEYDS